jgi:flagellar FliL protein
MAKAPTPQIPAPASKPGAAGGQSSKKATSEEVVGGASGGISVLAFIILTLLASGAGGGFGMVVSSQRQETLPKQEMKTKEAPASNISRLQMFSLPLPPITTNLAGSSRVWVRIECTLISPVEVAAEATSLTGQISEDIIAYLRTVTPEQLNGPGGFQHLREDLNDRVQIRTNSKATSIIIQALIIE